MRSGHARIAARVAQLPGLTLRRSHDPEGDAGIAVIAFAESAALAQAICAGITAAGVPAAPIYRSDTADLHVYPFWKPVLDAIAAAGAPAPDCPRTLDLLGRTIHLDVPPGLTDDQIDLICTAVDTAVAQARR
jgi:hypothetical protein